MDMNANYGGFAMALSTDPVWIMNIVPHTTINTLPVIYDRGLLGSYHDWLVFSSEKLNIHFPCLDESKTIHAAGVSHSQHTLGHMICYMLSTSFLTIKVWWKVAHWKISC